MIYAVDFDGTLAETDYPRIIMTNYEKIKNMSVEELVDFLCEFNSDICGFCSRDTCNNCLDYCDKGIRQWLKSEVTENEI